MRRSRLEILYLILKSCEKGASKTQITYDAQLNFKISVRYLKMLEGKNLIRTQPTDGRRIYRLTSRGRRLLYHLGMVIRLLEAELAS